MCGFPPRPSHPSHQIYSPKHHLPLPRSTDSRLVKIGKHILYNGELVSRYLSWYGPAWEQNTNLVPKFPNFVLGIHFAARSFTFRGRIIIYDYRFTVLQNNEAQYE